MQIYHYEFEWDFEFSPEWVNAFQWQLLKDPTVTSFEIRT